MTGASATGVKELAVLKGAEPLEATLRWQNDAIVCEVSWPKSYDEIFGQIAHSLRIPGDPLRADCHRTRKTLQLPADVGDLEAANAWFRQQFDAVKILPPTWILRTPAGDEICIRKAIDEPTLAMYRAGEKEWVYGEAVLVPFLDALNKSPLCVPGTATYVGGGSVEVNLTTAGLEQNQLACFLQLAGLYT